MLKKPPWSLFLVSLNSCVHQDTHTHAHPPPPHTHNTHTCIHCSSPLPLSSVRSSFSPLIWLSHVRLQLILLCTTSVWSSFSRIVLLQPLPLGPLILPLSLLLTTSSTPGLYDSPSLPSPYYLLYLWALWYSLSPYSLATSSTAGPSDSPSLRSPYFHL